MNERTLLLQARTLTDREQADLVIATTLHAAILGAGASLSTALLVPGLFVAQLERDRERAAT